MTGSQVRSDSVEPYRLKVKGLEQLRPELDRLKARGQKIVFTNGCFDILHVGHARYLNKARRLGDCLVVGVNSDRSVREIKGPERPVIPEAFRAELLAALGCVDAVVVFDEPDPLRVIQELRPQVLVKGGDWGEDEIIGSDVVKGNGGQVNRIPYIPGFSTTGILEALRAGKRLRRGS